MLVNEVIEDCGWDFRGEWPLTVRTSAITRDASRADRVTAWHENDWICEQFNTLKALQIPFS